jgi:hypothetical protein
MTWSPVTCQCQWPGLRVEEPSCSKQRPAPFPTQKLRLGTAHRPGATATGPGLTGRLGPGPGLTWTPRACHAARLKTQARPHCLQLTGRARPVLQICLYQLALRSAGGCHRCLCTCQWRTPGPAEAALRLATGSLGVWALKRPEAVASPSNPCDWCDPSCLRPVNTWTDFKFCRAKYGLSTIWYNKLKRYDTMDNMNNNKIQ